MNRDHVPVPRQSYLGANNDLIVYAARIPGLAHWGDAPGSVFENLMVQDSFSALGGCPTY